MGNRGDWLSASDPTGTTMDMESLWDIYTGLGPNAKVFLPPNNFEPITHLNPNQSRTHALGSFQDSSVGHDQEKGGGDFELQVGFSHASQN